MTFWSKAVQHAWIHQIISICQCNRDDNKPEFAHGLVSFLDGVESLLSRSSVIVLQSFHLAIFNSIEDYLDFSCLNDKDHIYDLVDDVWHNKVEGFAKFFYPQYFLLFPSHVADIKCKDDYANYDEDLQEFEYGRILI